VSAQERNKRVATRLSSLGDDLLPVLKAEMTTPDCLIQNVLPRLEDRPMLVIEEGRRDALVGVLAASDVL
jgi:hypothetical protein